jgi:hypothetical protein
MKLEFNTTFAVVIVALLLLICFCRQVLQALAAAADLCDKCSADLCDCHCIAALVSGQAARRVVAVYLLFLPITYNAVYFYHQSFTRYDWASSVVLVDFKYTAANATRPAALRLTSQTEVDTLFFIMPFALMVSLNTWVWLAFTTDARSHLTHDTVWDDSLPEPVAYYELVYYAELLAMNASFIALASSGRTFPELASASLALTLVQCSFVASARIRRDDAVARVSTTALTLLLVAAAFPLAAMLQTNCVLAETIAAVHATCVCLVTGLHFTANGEASASSILAVRVGTTVLASAAHLAVLIHGRNRACPP